MFQQGTNTCDEKLHFALKTNGPSSVGIGAA